MSIKIRLYWETSYDPRHLGSNESVRIIRLYVPVSIKTSTGWSYAYDAIIDTGSPHIVLPKKVWQTINIQKHLSEAITLGGIGKGKLMARLAKVKLAFLATRKEIIELTVKAYLAEDNSVPLLLGIEDLLTNARLVCDYPKDKAFLQFP